MKRKSRRAMESTLCLDFGTARTKAALVQRRDGYDEDLPLAIGQDGSFFLPSSVLIDGDGRVLFGDEAIERAETRSPPVIRIDSMKTWVCDGRLAEPLECELNQSRVRLAKRDVLTLFLAFATKRVRNALSRARVDWNDVQHRFAVPAWGDAVLAGVIPDMKRVLADASALCTAHGASLDRRPKLSDARRWLDELRDAPPDVQCAEHVLEPVAAGWRSVRGERGGGLILVVDVGAGTTDLAVFALHRTQDEARYVPLRGKHVALPVAGDRIDQVLCDAVLANVPRPTAADRQYVANRVRVWKETLFTDGRVLWEIQKRRSGAITVEEFCARRDVEELFTQIIDRAEELIEGLDKGLLAKYADAGLRVLLTGGGAALPGLDALKSGERLPHGIAIRYRSMAAEPPDLETELFGDYPAMAVAIGGATIEQPEVLDEFDLRPLLGPTVTSSQNSWTGRATRALY